jgi:hypothetical protein
MVRNCANDQLTVGSRGTDPRGNGRLQGEAEAGHVLLRRAGLLPGQWPFLSYLTATPAEQYIRGRYRAPSVINGVTVRYKTLSQLYKKYCSFYQVTYSTFAHPNY